MSFNDTYIDNDLYSTYLVVGENILRKFHLSKNGQNYPEFQIKIEKLVFQKNQTEPGTRDKLGAWKTGLTEADLIIARDGKEALWKAYQARGTFGDETEYYEYYDMTEFFSILHYAMKWMR